MSEITCNGCGSVWEIDDTETNKIIAHLIECPLCAPKKEEEVEVK